MTKYRSDIAPHESSQPSALPGSNSGSKMPGATNESRTIGAIRVCDFDRLMRTDDITTVNALRSLRRDLIMPMSSGYAARLLKIDADLMLFEFKSPEDAVLYAINLQRSILSRKASTSQHRQLELLVGFHLGDVIFDERDVYGEGLGLAARIADESSPGGICVSDPVNDRVAERLALPFAKSGTLNSAENGASLSLFSLPADFIAEQPESDLSKGSTVARVRVTIREGTHLNDAYEIDRFIGTGGMGEIFRAHEIQTGEPVAIKLIRPEMEDDTTVLSLFQKEALILKNISHDAVVRYYAFSLDQTIVRRYLAMEYVDGPSLSALIKRGPLSTEAIKALRQRVASGLHVAHQRGIVHRDLTPDNIILPDGSGDAAKIIDFGIARASDLGGATIIGDGFAGKFNYASPEQLGLYGATVTAKSDIYSFGLVLAAAAAGRAINMGGSHAETVGKRRTVPDLGHIDERLRPLLAAMLQPNPEDRPNSMAEVASWQFTAKRPENPRGGQQDDQTVLAIRKPKPVVQHGGPTRRIVLLSAAASIVLLIGAVGLYMSARSPGSHGAHEGETAQLTPDPSSGTLVQNRTEPPPAQAPPADATTAPSSEPSVAEAPPPETPGTSASPEKQPSSGETGGNEKPAVPSGQGTVVASRETKEDEIIGQVRSYNGGPCFFAKATSATSATLGIEAFASSSGAFDTLDEALTKTLGFEPDIVGNVVWSRQCPAIDFLKAAQAGENEKPPIIFLKSARVNSGQSLSGNVSATGDQSVALLDIREDGTIENLSSALLDKPSGQEFDVKLESRQKGDGPFPHLLVAVVGSEGLQALPTEPVSSDALFKALRDQHGHLKASAKLVLVRK